MRRIFSLLLTGLLLPAGPLRAADPPPPLFADDWESLRRAPVPAWFEDAKFGIFIHWGAYSVAGYHAQGKGYAEHFPKFLYASPGEYYPFLREHFGGVPPAFGYQDLIPLFRAEKWRPEEWADLFRRAGARYVVLTAEHHDGFALWDSELTPWCATKMGPHRDLVGDLARAVRARGLKFAPSYHRERHPGFFARELYAPVSTPRPDVAAEIAQRPAAAGLYGPFAYTDEFIADYVARWQELDRKFRPDFLWLDDIPLFYKAPNAPETQKFRNACRRMIAEYLNAAAARGQAVYLNNKGPNGNWPAGVGCREKDNLRLPVSGPKWQNPATLGTSYGYLAVEEEQDRYKSPAELIRLLCDVVSKNGNLLLNIGPRADGTIPEGMTRRLLAIGGWLDVNGEAIYGTRPWRVPAETPPKPGERTDVSHPPPPTQDWRFTLGGSDRKTLYAVLLGPAPAGAQVTIASLSPGGAGADWPLTRVDVLGSEERVVWQRTPAGLVLALPRQLPARADLGIVVRLGGK